MNLQEEDIKKIWIALFSVTIIICIVSIVKMLKDAPQVSLESSTSRSYDEFGMYGSGPSSSGQYSPSGSSTMGDPSMSGMPQGTSSSTSSAYPTSSTTSATSATSTATTAAPASTYEPSNPVTSNVQADVPPAPAVKPTPKPATLPASSSYQPVSNTTPQQHPAYYPAQQPQYPQYQQPYPTQPGYYPPQQPYAPAGYQYPPQTMPGATPPVGSSIPAPSTPQPGNANSASSAIYNH